MLEEKEYLLEGESPIEFIARKGDVYAKEAVKDWVTQRAVVLGITRQEFVSRYLPNGSIANQPVETQPKPAPVSHISPYRQIKEKMGPNGLATTAREVALTPASANLAAFRAAMKA